MLAALRWQNAHFRCTPDVRCMCTLSEHYHVQSVSALDQGFAAVKAETSLLDLHCCYNCSTTFCARRAQNQLVLASTTNSKRKACTSVVDAAPLCTSKEIFPNNISPVYQVMKSAACLHILKCRGPALNAVLCLVHCHVPCALS